MSSLAVELRNITKKYPGITANDNVSLGVMRGEIHALVGENGAGKTTLMNILYGLLRPDSGKIFVKGNRISSENPHTAIKHGIGMVHQHFMLINRFSVVQNIILGKEPGPGPFISMKKSMDIISNLAERYGLEVDPVKKVGDISVGMAQRVEILKVLYRGADILVLDEPTAVLTPQESEEFFKILSLLRESGHTVIFITHKLKEVFRIADRVTVMRKAKVVGVRHISETSQTKLSQMMLGKTVSGNIEKPLTEPGRNILEVKDLCLQGEGGGHVLDMICLSVRKGEIVGIAGVQGSGQTELMESLWGLKRITSGSIHYSGKDITGLSPADRASMGISYIPDDRQRFGLVMEYPVSLNLVLGRHREPSFSGRYIMKHSNIRDMSKRIVSEYGVYPNDIRITAASLSGGNQQKLVVAREINRDPWLILASNPTRGVDIGVVQEIYRKLMEEVSRGKGILLVSSDLNEILTLSDRVAVMYGGRIAGWTTPDKTDEKELGMMMTGAGDG
ncbi:MAG: ABC transporter ATP-binding protein [Elusimicrobiota bacterium]